MFLYDQQELYQHISVNNRKELKTDVQKSTSFCKDILSNQKHNTEAEWLKEGEQQERLKVKENLIRQYKQIPKWNAYMSCISDQEADNST